MGKKKKSKIKGQKLSRSRLKKALLSYLRNHDSKAYSARQLVKKLKIANNKYDVQDQLDFLEQKGHVYRIHEIRYGAGDMKKRKLNRKPKIYEGIVDKTRSGSAFIICDNLVQDIYVSASKLSHALDGDRVSVQVEKWGANRPQGKVLKIIERARNQFIGIYHQFKRTGIVVLDSDNIPFDIFIHPDNVNEAADGEKVIVKVTDWQITQSKSPAGQIVEILGASGSHDIEMKAILVEEGFNLSFPDDVKRELKALNGSISKQEIQTRRDCRPVPTFTIDPEDAKDFDDALSFRRLQNGNVEVGVHIADVTHYVRPGTALDKEALERSTSVYLVDRVLPMLPEKLSNELCSLRPNEDSLCFSAIFEIDENNHVIKRWFGKTIIHSDHRFSYEMAQGVLDKGSGPFLEELKHLNKIATAFRKRRMKNGSLMFETDEVRFQLDEHGVPIEIFVKERGESHLLIEDLMLLANREVATYMAKKGKGQEVPFVYRIHDLPDPQKLAELALFAKELGFEMKVDTPRQVPKSFNALARAAEECEALKILEPIAIRTMAKAEYHTINIGHYGLAFAHYAHFTSPIRRYADVLVHRILEENLRAIKRYDREELQKKCSHISSQERKAQKAERNSIKYKQAEYLEKHVGEVFEGYVTGLIDRGIFVQLKEIMAEGLVGFDKFSEPFDLDEGRLRATGRKTGRMIKMGDQVIVRILGADPSKRQIELQMVRHG